MTISVIIPAYNAEATLMRCLEAAFACQGDTFECIIVDDCSTDSTANIASGYSVHLVKLTGGPYGPAEARNQGAMIAAGEILLFLDADVLLPEDGLIKIATLFRSQPEISALFGSYDDTPEDAGFLSQYKNLAHHFTHQSARDYASTFWSGCGAIRRNVFTEIGGFDSHRYPRPSIEDIELGTRLRAAGYLIRLVKDLQVKHLKRWSLAGLIKTDVVYRGIPWTRLILRNRDLPDDLNLTMSQRVAALLAVLLAGMLVAGLTQPDGVLLPLALLQFLLIIDWLAWDQPFAWLPAGCNPLPAGALATLLLLVGLSLGNPWLSYAAGAILTAALILSIIRRAPLAIRCFYFTAVYLVAFTVIILVIVQLPIWFSAAVILLLGGIAILNLKLIQYFAQLRGVLFCFAALQMQVFYYWYSMIAFCIACVQHLLSGKEEKGLA